MTNYVETVDTADQFGEFINSIKLDGRPAERIESAIVGITTACAVLGLSKDDVIVQGSYANHTAVEPVDGGYDVDLVLPCIERGTGTTKALEIVQQAFLDNGRYKDKVEAKTRCIRLNYVDDDIGAFHVDLVPARPAQDDSNAPLEVPHKDNRWNETAPAEYTQWSNDQGLRFANTVMILKRWRDKHQSDGYAVKSIIFQVLVHKHLADADDDAERLASTLRNIADDLGWRSDPPPLPNPVLDTEDLAARWSPSAFEDFKAKIAEAADMAEHALRACDLVEACEKWRQLLGSDFPEAPASEHGIRLADTSHQQAYEQMGWTASPRKDKFTIEAHKAWNNRTTSRFRPYKEGKLIRANDNLSLRFQTRDDLPDGSTIKWQVVNTGDHAHRNKGGRGEFTDSRPVPVRTLRPSPSATHTTWQRAAYTGVHKIRAVAVRQSLVVAESQWIEVSIRAPNVTFKP